MRTLAVVLVVICLCSTVQAVPVNPDGSTFFFAGLRLFVLCQDGSVTQIDASGSVFPQQPVPIPLEDIEEYFGFFLVTKDGEVWKMDYTAWVVLDDLPCPVPIANQDESMGVSLPNIPSGSYLIT